MPADCGISHGHHAQQRQRRLGFLLITFLQIFYIRFGYGIGNATCKCFGRIFILSKASLISFARLFASILLEDNRLREVKEIERCRQLAQSRPSRAQWL